jgi:type IV pilus assembly protein PilM
MLNLGKKNSFGIDIGTQTIKITEISNRNNQFFIDNYSIWDDDIENIIQEKDSDISLSSEKITKIIQVMASEAGMNIKQAYISLPSYLAFFAIIQIPILELEELLSAVPLEARKHIPVPLNTVHLDWINLGKNIAQDQYNILIIAMPNNVITKYLDISKSLGINVKGFDLDCFSIIRSMKLPITQTCILDFGARNSTVMIVSPDKKLQTIQSFDFGGNHITKLIAEFRKISVIEAENIKKQNGINGLDSQISDFIQSKINNFIKNDVMRLIKQSDSMTGKKVENIVLLGGASKMNGMKEYTESILQNSFPEYNINIDIASPINNLKIKNLSDNTKFEAIWRDLFLSTGVALRNYIE